VANDPMAYPWILQRFGNLFAPYARDVPPGAGPATSYAVHSAPFIV